ncbi:MAG: PAS domain-containing protein [Deltaproteobacteria bacterium]|nr:PAS domain-containing protein [Deltaproteobacteria bacterium]
MKSRLFFKIFATYLVIITLTLGITGLLLSSGIRKEETKKTHGELLSLARVMARMSESDIRRLVSSFAGMSRTRVTMIDKSGTVIADSEADAKNMENHLNRVEIQQAQAKGQGMDIRYSHTLSVDMLYVAVPLQNGAESKGYIRLARSLLAVDAAIKNLLESISYTVFIIIALSSLIALTFSWKLLSPIRKIANFTRGVRGGEISGTLLIDSGGEIGQLAKDINYMVMELQEKIRLSKEEKGKLEAAFAGMVEGVIILDRQDRIEKVNRGMDAILCNHCGPILNKTLLEAFRNVQLHNALERFKKERAPVLQEIILDGTSPLILDVTISAVADASGNRDKTILVFHDVTRLHRLETIRTDFVANVTHEIKTPLTAIIGFAETLEKGPVADTETEQKFLRTISENARRLDRLVDDLLTLSGIELGDLPLNRDEFPVAEAIENALSVIGGRAKEKAIAVHWNADDSLHPIRGDRDRVFQVLLNILDNAVKFTAQGGKIAIGASIANGDYVVVKIADNGMGIPQSDIPRLGERFYRVDKARSRELGGTGLGLSIVKHLMKRMDGRIEIESRLGAGTTVSLFFPVSVG